MRNSVSRFLSVQGFAFGVALLAFVFVLGGAASAQKFANFNPESMGNGERILDILLPDGSPTTLAAGGGGNGKKKLTFSPRHYLTLGNPGNYFGVFDSGLAKMSLNPGTPKPAFDGTPFNFNSIDAVDFEKVPDNFGPDGSGGKKIMYFSVRWDTFLTDTNPFFVRAGDVAMLDMDSWTFSHYFQPWSLGLAQTDACFILPEGKLGFSPFGDWFYTAGTPTFFRDEDIAMWDPNTNQVSPFIWGQDLGIHSLDGADLVENDSEKLYYSVRNPEFLPFAKPNPVFLQDGDVACYDFMTKETTLALKGNYKFIYSIDALSVRYKEEPPR